MKSFRMFFRSIRDAFKSVIRNFSLSIASIACITITLIIIASALIISENVRNFTKLIKEDVTIVAFLDSDITADERKTFEGQIQNLENIDSFEFMSKAEVKEDMSNDYKELSDILNDWDENENPLKDTYTVKVQDVEQINKTATSIENLDKVSSVQYGEGLVEKLVGVFDAVEKATFVAALALIIVTVFLIINTIKLTIFSRQTEIGIMRLVGASNMRIRLPFIVEGIVLGMIGSVIPIIITVYGYTSLYNSFGGVLFSSLIKLVKPTPFVIEVAAVILGVGMLVGMLGSARAVRRYINKQ